jgi:hypothetical protein
MRCECCPFAGMFPICAVNPSRIWPGAGESCGGTIPSIGMHCPGFFDAYGGWPSSDGRQQAMVEL